MKAKPKKKTAKRNSKALAVQVKPQTVKGGRICSVCSHPDRAELDKGLVNGSLKAAEVARRVGCSRTSVTRHVKNHLIKNVQESMKAANTSGNTEDIDLVNEVKMMYSKVKTMLEALDTEPNWKAQKAFHGEIRGYLELLGKFLGKLETGTTVNVIVSPVWVQMRTVIVKTLAPYPEASQAVANALVEIDKGASNNVTV